MEDLQGKKMGFVGCLGEPTGFWARAHTLSGHTSFPCGQGSLQRGEGRTPGPGYNSFCQVLLINRFPMGREPRSGRGSHPTGSSRLGGEKGSARKSSEPEGVQHASIPSCCVFVSFSGPGPPTIHNSPGTHQLPDPRGELPLYVSWK